MSWPRLNPTLRFWLRPRHPGSEGPLLLQELRSNAEEDDDGEGDEEIHDAAKDDDDVADILHVTPIRSAAKVPSRGNQTMKDYIPYGAEGILTEVVDHDHDVNPDEDVGPFSDYANTDPYVVGPSYTVPDTADDDIEKDLFPRVPGSYYSDYPKGGVVVRSYRILHKEWELPHHPAFEILSKELFKDPIVCRAVVDQFPTPAEVIRVETPSDDQLMNKMNVLHCLMMSHDGELMARFQGLFETHEDYRSKSDGRHKSLQQLLIV
ncbi:hypothetical protein Tco_1188607 [Tanacetum coccineum]